MGLTLTCDIRYNFVNVYTSSGSLNSNLEAYSSYTIGTINNAIPGAEKSFNICLLEGCFGRITISTGGTITLIPYNNILSGFTPMIFFIYSY